MDESTIHTSVVEGEGIVGIGVHFGQTTTGTAVTFEGSKCEAATHAVVLAIGQLMERPDLDDGEWTIITPCAFVAEGAKAGYSMAGRCDSCGCEGNADQVAELIRLLQQLPRSITVEHKTEADEAAHKLAAVSIGAKEESGCVVKEGED